MRSLCRKHTYQNHFIVVIPNVYQCLRREYVTPKPTSKSAPRPPNQLITSPVFGMILDGGVDGFSGVLGITGVGLLVSFVV